MNNNIGEFIKLLRTEKKLTQRELGNLLDIDDKTISKWERGVYLPDITMLSPLSKALDITVDELLECKRHEPLQPEIVKIIEPVKENPIIEPPSSNKSPKSKLILKIILIILGLTLISLLFFTIYLKYTNTQKENLSSDDVNVYKITSDDENLIVEGYIIEKNEEHLLIVKRLCFKNTQLNDKDLSLYNFEMKIYFPNQKLLLYKEIKKENILLEGNNFNINGFETQNIQNIEKITYNYATLLLQYSIDETLINQTNYRIKLIKIF